MALWKIAVFCCALSVVHGSSRHEIAKRWAYVENGDPQMRSIHTDCKEIVRSYSDGEMPFYEYTAKMQKCLNRQQRTNIPHYEDAPFFTPTFNLPTAEKRYDTPKPSTPSYNQAYAYDNTNQYNQNSYATADQRNTITSPQSQQYQTAPAPAQSFSPPAQYNSYEVPAQQQTQMYARNAIPSNTVREFVRPNIAGTAPVYSRVHKLFPGRSVGSSSSRPEHFLSRNG